MDATITGSTTSRGSMPEAASSPTASTTVAFPSRPVLTARTGRSSTTARIWATTTSVGTGCTWRTSVVFCAVTAVTAVVARTPNAAMVLHVGLDAGPRSRVRAGDGEGDRGITGFCHRSIMPSKGLDASA